MDVNNLIRDYGYWAVLAGTFLEGETILILAGVAAQFGTMELPLVILSAFAGSACGDQLYYFIGRKQGAALLRRFPRWHRAAAKVARRIQSHQNLIILTFRFFYGVRNVTPFMLGISRVPVARFVPLNLLGAAVWASAFASLGYLLGQAHDRILGKGYNLAFLALLLAAGAGYYLFSRWRSRRAPPKETADEERALAEIESSAFPVPPREPPGR